MTTKRNPEERPGRSGTAGAGGMAKPTGDEVYEPRTATPSPNVEGETAESEASEEARARLRQLAAGYYENLSETAEELSREAAEVFDVTSQYLRRNPWTSITVAAATGLLIGLILTDD